MWLLIKAWLDANLFKLLAWLSAGAAALAILFGAKQSGRQAERTDQLKKIVEVKDAQLRATLNAPRNRAELINRLRSGKF